MTTDDLLLFGALTAIAVSAAYLLGRRRSDPENAPSPATAAAPVPSAPAAARTPASAPAAAAPAPAPKPAAKPKAAASAPVKLDYEEDENVDPTRVGNNAASNVAGRAIQPPIKRIAYDDDAQTDEPTHAQSFFLVHASAETDPGLRRKRNEDALLVLEKENLFVIADGMGGYQGGQIASQTAVKTIADAYMTQTFEGAPHTDVPVDATNLARAIQMANAAILGLAQQDRELEGMGTTVCAARFSPNKKRLFVGHVGDSRCYRLRGGALQQVTADHTMADFGVQGPAAAQLSRAVGIWPAVPIDIVSVVPATGDVYMLCSDGLTKMLPDEAIAQVLKEHEDPHAAVERLIASANERGGKDNITVILVRVVPPSWKTPAAAT